MNKIDDLLEKLSPKGVKFEQLGEVCSTFSGGFIIKTKQDPEFPYPVFNGGAFATGRYGEFNSEANSIAISARGSIGFVNWIPYRFWAGNSCHVVLSKVQTLETKYLYYYLKAHESDLYALRNVGSIPALNLGPLLKFKIPIPPLEVQKEIVAILDTFSELEAALEAELEAELEARRTQFAFLLDQVFDNEEIRKNGLTKLSEHGEFDRGNGLQKTDFSENGVGCIHYGQIYTKFGSHANDVYTYVPEELAAKFKKVKQGNLVITTTSENIQDVCKAVAWLGQSEIVIGGHSCVYRHDLDPLFATYLFRSRLFQDQKNSYVQGTKVKDIKPVQIGKIEVYIPPMKTQIEIGLMMRNFDSLLEDVSIGLPAEIAARRQQYEYYRSKLLTFRALEAV